MKHLQLTREIAFAAARDAGNRHMIQAGRKRWNDDDYNAAVDEFERLWPQNKDLEVARREKQ